MFNAFRSLGGADLVSLVVGVVLLFSAISLLWAKRVPVNASISVLLVGALLVFWPNLGSGKLTKQGFSIDRQVTVNVDTREAIENIRDRLAALETTLKSFPAPALAPAENGKFTWDPLNQSAPKFSANDVCKTFPAICDDGNVRLPDNGNLGWERYFRSSDSVKLNETIEALKQGNDALREQLLQ